MSAKSPGQTGFELLELLRHAVGKRGHRNHFAAEVDGDDWRSWELLTGLGLAQRGQCINSGTLQLFHVSCAGVAMLRKLSPGKYSVDLRCPKSKSIEELIDASSLGTPEAKAIRAQADPKAVARVMTLLQESDLNLESHERSP